uniref:Uncharacterized protein n=1 Tax=Cyanothece sp. (strain PCC 7425 / ATCC 29141) TaxID=395961 RepID=B8HTX9_CYAP4
MPREQRLQFIKAHQAAFEVEPLYPLALFEALVETFDEDCALEASCKIEFDQLIASRFLIFFSQNFEQNLARVLNFMTQVNQRVDVQINTDLLYHFLGQKFDFRKMIRLATGVDLRSNLADSSLKIHIRLEDYPEKIESALALHGNPDDASYWADLNAIANIGLDFYLDGRSEIEFYPELSEERFQQPEMQVLLQQMFPPFVLAPLKASEIFGFGLSKANPSAVLYYQLKNKQDLPSYFAINDKAHQVHGYYLHQDTRPYMCVGVAQSELAKTRIDQIRLYYHQFFKVQNP